MKDEKGITFKNTTEEQAEKYFSEKNNYLRTAAYKRNYQKYMSGENKGKYISLDFSYLQELSTIDMHFRFIVYRMCLDVEHALKVKIISDIENDTTTDGYDIIKEFFDNNGDVLRKIESTSKAPFTCELIQEYFTITTIYNAEKDKNESKIIGYDECPAWVLVELVTFGDFLRFYDFYYDSRKMKKIDFSILSLVRNLRNGCAHNNCILSDLKHGTSHPPMKIKTRIAQIPTLTKNQRQKKLSCRPMLEFVCLLYVYNLVVSEEIKKYRMGELEDLFFFRMLRHKEYFASNELIKSNYQFACEVIKNLKK